MQSIIDRDIEFYDAEMERCRAEFMRCSMRDESTWQTRKAAAESVVYALRLYKSTLGE